MIEWLSWRGDFSLVLEWVLRLTSGVLGYSICAWARREGYRRGRRDAYREMIAWNEARFAEMLREFDAEISTSKREDFMRH